MTSRLAAWLGLAVFAAVAARPAAAGVPLYLDQAGQPARHVVPVVSNPTTPAVNPGVGAELAGLVAEAGGLWAAVPSAQISFQTGTPIAQPVATTNYGQILAVCGDDLSPLIADPDGAIVDDLFGVGASESILGVGISDCDPTGDGLIPEHTMLVNFSALPSASPEREALGLRVVTHELGHVIGVAHTLLNLEFLDDGNGPNDVYLPIMVPILSDDDPIAPARLSLDDATIVSLLYPAAGFVPGTATVAGLARLPPNGRPVSGTFLAVRSTSDPLGTAVFTASGLTPVGVTLGGIFAALGQVGEPLGAFQASGLPPGEYTLEVLGGVNGEQAEFFSGAGEGYDPAVDLPDQAEPLVLAAGQVVDDADLLLDEDPATVGARAADTAWNVRWRGRAKVPRRVQRIPASGLPPPGRLELLGTGGVALRSGSTFDTLIAGSWTPAAHGRGTSRRRFVHTIAEPDALVVFSETLFGGAAVFTEIEAGGTTNGRTVKGSIKLRGLYFGGASGVRLTLTYKYKGKPALLATEPGPVPPISPVAVVIDPPFAAVSPGSQVSFTASVEGATSSVTWEVVGPGTIDAAGVYTAPGAGASRAQVIARCRSDRRAMGLAAVDVAP